MRTDDLILIAMGAMSLLIGLGFAFVRPDERSRSRDMERFGKRDALWGLNVVMGYSLLRLGALRWTLAIVAIVVGLAFIAMGLGWISHGWSGVLLPR